MQFKIGGTYYVTHSNSNGVYTSTLNIRVIDIRHFDNRNIYFVRIARQNSGNIQRLGNKSNSYECTLTAPSCIFPQRRGRCLKNSSLCCGGATLNEYTELPLLKALICLGIETEEM